jgi:hypothetical protein
MTIDFSCPCCDSTNLLHLPAYLSKFVVWRTTGCKPDANQQTLLIKCESCNYYFCSKRFTENEILGLYSGYRNEKYNNMRSECEPNYKKELYSEEYIKNRKQFINNLIFKHAHELDSILDYGGDDGRYIPNVSTKYVYDLSDTIPIDNVKKFDPASSDKFDLVMNCQVLEHVSDVNNLLEILKSYTKKYLYIEVPAYREPPPINVVIGEHVNFFRKQSLHALLNKHNINIVDTAIDYELKVLAVLGKI